MILGVSYIGWGVGLAVGLALATGVAIVRDDSRLSPAVRWSFRLLTFALGAACALTIAYRVGQATDAGTRSIGRSNDAMKNNIDDLNQAQGQ